MNNARSGWRGTWRRIGRSAAGWLLLPTALAACSSSANPSVTPPAAAVSMSDAGPSSPPALVPTQAGAAVSGTAPAMVGLAASGAGASAPSTVNAGAAAGSQASDVSAGSGGAMSAALGGAGGALAPDMGMHATAGSGGGAGAASSARTATVSDYAKLGPYGKGTRLKNQGTGTISGGTMGSIGEGGDDPSGFTLFFPKGAKSDERFPLLTWGNGTLCSPTLYDELMNFIVSYGYVVIASNTSNAGTGAEMLKAVDWALAQNDKADSPIHGMIDRDKIGAFGHSQGGEGAVNAASDARIRAVAPLSAGPMGSGEGKIQCPTFYTLTANDVVTPDSYRASYDGTKTPSVYGVTSSGDHMEYTDKANGIGLPGLTSNDAEMTRGAITAWFEWQLKGKQEIKPLFVGKDCGFCKDANWKSFESKGL
jgi:hypothetical protein